VHSFVPACEALQSNRLSYDQGTIGRCTLLVSKIKQIICARQSCQQVASRLPKALLNARELPIPGLGEGLAA